MKKIYKTAIVLCLLAFVTAGCKSAETTEYAFSADKVEQISVSAEGSDVKLSSTEEKSVTVNMLSKDEWTAKLENGTLKVDIPSSSGPVNLESQTLYIEVPAEFQGKLHLTSVSGNIDVNGLRAVELAAETDSGGISIVDMAGNIAADTDSGKIKSSLPISSLIVPQNAGYSLKGTIKTDSGPSSMKLHSVSGTISVD